MDLVQTESTPRGFTSTFVYDRAGQVTTREVREGTALVATETFAYDELGRVLTLGNGGTTIQRKYDSAGGVLSEKATVDGIERELRRTFDAAGAVTSVTYPGGRELTYEVDDLGRFDKLKLDSATLLDYDWLGADRVGTKTAGPVTSTYAYDVEHLPESIAREVSGEALRHHTLTWTDRHEVDAETDVLRRSSSSRFAYDAAGRLASAAFAVPAGAPSTSALRSVDFGHDAVRNLRSRVEKVGGPYQRELGVTTVASGNRYSVFDGNVRVHDADGNLTDDGAGRTLVYDWAGRLTTVARSASVVTYGYDVLGRKVKRTEAGVTRRYWYDGWELIEETGAGSTVERELVNGQSVDEPLFFVADGEERHIVQDRMGSVTGVVDAAGELLEAYEYGPYGTFRRHGPESLEQARLESESLVLRFTGEMGEAAVSALSLFPNITGNWTFSADGRELRFLPVDEAPEDGEPDWPSQTVTVTVPASTRTAFGLELTSAWSHSFSATDMSDRVLADLRAPEVERIGQDPDDTLRVVFSEPMSSEDLAEAFVLRESLSPAPIPFTVTLQGSEVLITPGEELTIGEGYRLALLAAKAKDLAEQSAPARSWSWTRKDHPVRIWDTETDSVAVSLFGNRLFFQGRELDEATGLYDFRNRWYDPESGRFLTPDPLGYPDGPNQYAAFLADPANNSDPTGEAVPLLALGFAAYLGLTEHAASSNPDSFLGSMAPSQNAARLGGLDPNSGEHLSALDMTLAAVGVAGDLTFGAGAFLKLSGGVRAATAIERLARADRVLAGASVALHSANGNPVAAGFAAFGLLGPGRTPCRSSFAEGTPVLTPTGSVPIEQIRTGDEVIAWDDATQAPIARRVLGTSVRVVGELIVLEVAGTTIETTAEHPFWVVGQGWTEAVHLQAGEELFSATGETFAIGSIGFRYGSFVVRNFEVEVAHNYLVGTTPILVHNENSPCGRLFPGLADAELDEAFSRARVGVFPGNPPTKTKPSGRYQIAQTGPETLRIHGGGAQFDIDGIEGMQIAEVKHARPRGSPYVPGSSAPAFVRKKVLRDVYFEFRRAKAIISDQTTPFEGLRLITNDPEAARAFERIRRAMGIPGETVLR